MHQIAIVYIPRSEWTDVAPPLSLETHSTFMTVSHWPTHNTNSKPPTPHVAHISPINKNVSGSGKHLRKQLCTQNRANRILYMGNFYCYMKIWCFSDIFVKNVTNL